MPFNMVADTNHATLLKNQSTITYLPYKRFLLNFGCKINFMCFINFWHQQSQSNAFSHVAMDAYSSQSVNLQEIFNAYIYRIYKLDSCFNNFHIFRFSRSRKREVGVNSFMSKHSSVYNALFCYDPLAHLAIDASSRVKSCQSRFRGQILKRRKT